MRYLVLGGGISGVCCAEELCKLCPQDEIELVSSDKTLKGVGNVVKYTDNLEDFEIVERDLTSLPYPNLTVQQGIATSLLAHTKQVILKDGRKFSYDKLCICTGAIPKAAWHSPHVLVLRDQHTIQTLAKRLPGMQRVVLVGNGGIALEVAHALTGVEVIWTVKHTHIGDAFFDLDAASFLCTQLPQASSSAQSSGSQHSATAGSAAPEAEAGAQGKTPQEPPPSRQGHPNETRLHPEQHGASQQQSIHSHQAGDYSAKNDLVMNGSTTSDSAKQRCANQNKEAASVQQLPQRAQQQRRGKHGHTDSNADQHTLSAQMSEDQPEQDGARARSAIKAEQGIMSFGHAVGPQWASQLPQSPSASHITLEYGVEVTAIHSYISAQDTAYKSTASPSTAQQNSTLSSADMEAGNSEATHNAEDARTWAVTVGLSNGKSYGADLVISAIGVEPNVGWLPEEMKRDARDGGIVVDRLMQSSEAGVYAAGDACTIAWTDKSPHWFQMRLWTQARIQGMFAAHAMAGVTDEMAFGFNFELFTHVTRFCGRKVVLLGLYNGQGLQDEPEQDMVTYSRTTEGSSPTFVRVLLLRGRMQGAVLVGETELEETFEHLILDGLDLTRYGPDLLAPAVELEMIFD